MRLCSLAWPRTGALLLATASAGCDALFGPASYEEAMRSVGPVMQAGQMGKANRLCRRAFEFADKAGNGSGAVLALDCMAAATGGSGGKDEQVLPTYATVLGRYDASLQRYVGRFRLRNDYGVALYLSGKQNEGMRVLAESLDAYTGTPYASTHHAVFAQRMRIVVNLARASRSRPGSAEASRLLGPLADEIEAVADAAGTADGAERRVAEALAALSDLARSGGDGARADALAARAAQRQSLESEAARAQAGAKPECHKIELFGTPIERCFARLP